MSELEDIGKHLEELRKRVIRIVLVIGIITACLLSFHLEPIQIEQTTLYYPILDPLNNTSAQITYHMKENLVPENVQLIQTAPGQAFFAQVYIAALVGIIVGMPVVIIELVSFIKPALKEKEVKISRSISIPA
ncbi:MAG: twin-arginine translocase subunit TatC, partial [Nitrosopumilus sp.]|nr:twin-arginine translocase subunit TatC [Nitrosopumilus sp.]